MSDKTMAQLIEDAVREQMDPKAIEPKISAAVDKLISDVIGSTLRVYGHNGKIIEKAIMESLKISTLDLPAYGATVCTIIERQIKETTAALIEGQLTKDIQERLMLAPKEIKLSAIVKQMLEEHWQWEDGGDDPLITCIVERREHSSLTFVYLDPDDVHTSEDKYRCQINFHVGANGTIEGGSVSPRSSSVGRKLGSTKNFGGAYGLEGRMQTFWACGTKIIVDEDDCEDRRYFD